jgi:proton-translocating NADH-quinone oxidoreductase chain N
MTLPAFIWLIMVPLMWAPLIYLVGRLSRRKPIEQPSMARWVALPAIFSSWLPFAATARSFYAQGATSYTLGTITLRLDGLSLLLAATVLTLTTLVTIYSIRYMAGEVGESKYYAMLMAMTGVIMGMGCATDLFNLWVWFEAMAVTSYLLVSFYREQPASLEAGIKYLVQSATGSVLVLMGVALVLAQTGTLDLVNIQAVVQSGQIQTLTMLAAGAFFVIGFGVKIALVPLHTWLPDAHSQAPSGISAMLSGVVIEAALIALMRILPALAGAAATWGELLMGFGALNMLGGNLLALRQRQMKRMLAFSSLSHVGYMLVGLGIAVYAGQVAAAQGGLFHLLSHMLMKGLAFLAAGTLLFALHTAVGDHSPLTINDMAGASRRYPLTALTLSLALLGLAGLPPLVGFMSKWQILAAGFATGNLLIYGLVAFVALNSVLSLVYYAPVVNVVYRRQPSTAVLHGQPVPVTMNLPLILLGTAVVVIGVWPQMVNWLTAPAGAALLAAFGS